jgi:hypothetical protein
VIQRLYTEVMTIVVIVVYTLSRTGFTSVKKASHVEYSMIHM